MLNLSGPIVCVGLLFLSIIIEFEYLYAREKIEPDQTSKEIYELINRAKEFRSQGEYDSSRVILMQAEKVADLNSKHLIKAKAINEDGVLYIYQLRYSEALSRLQEALNIYEENINEPGIAECLNNIATVHFSQSDFRLALENYQRSLELRLKGSDLREIGVSYNNVGIVFSRMNQIDSSVYYHRKSLDIWTQINSNSGIGVTLIHLGECEKLKKNFEAALDLYLQSYSIFAKTNDGSRASISAEVEIGLLYLEMGNFENGLTWCGRAYEKSRALSLRQSTLNACFCLYKIYKELGDFEKSVKFFEEYIVLRDSSFGPEMMKEVTRIELNYAFKKIKEADSLRYLSERKVQEQMITQQRNALLSFSGILILAAALGFAIYKGKKRSDALLLNILPRETARELKQKGMAKARYHPEVTVLFTDFIGFTRTSERFSPNELVSELHQYFSAFDQIIEKHGLEKIKTIGDSYMAASGLPLAKERHAFDAVNAALDILKYVTDVKLKSQDSEKMFFEIRIGIHTGPVVSGIVGTKKFQYDIWGDTVNTASRMESSSEAGYVNCSESTYFLIKKDFDCLDRGKISVKGKGDIKMYYILSPSSMSKDTEYTINT
jgi:adenylate cyclase